MAQVDTQSTSIGGVTYTVAPLDPFVANRLLVKIGHVLGPTFGALAASEGASNANGLISEAIGGVFTRLDPDDFEDVLRTLAGVTEVHLGSDKRPQLSDIIALHFRGKIGPMYEWLAFAMKVQFKDFFDLAVPAIARASAIAGAGSNSPTTSQNTTGSTD